MDDEDEITIEDLRRAKEMLNIQKVPEPHYLITADKAFKLDKDGTYVDITDSWYGQQ